MPKMIENVGGYYHDIAGKMQAEAARPAEAQTKKVKALRRSTYNAYVAACRRLLSLAESCKTEHYRHRSDDERAPGDQLKFHPFPGVEIEINGATLPASTEPGHILAAYLVELKEEKRLCAVRCQIASALQTGEITRFVARVRTVCGKAPTMEQVDALIRPFIFPEEHACPVTGRRR